MTAKDGKNDPQENTAPNPEQKNPKPGHLFPDAKLDNTMLQQRLVNTCQRIRTLEAQLAAINREKKEEIKKQRDTMSSLLDQIEELG